MTVYTTNAARNLMACSPRGVDWGYGLPAFMEPASLSIPQCLVSVVRNPRIPRGLDGRSQCPAPTRDPWVRTLQADCRQVAS